MLLLPQPAQPFRFVYDARCRLLFAMPSGATA